MALQSFTTIDHLFKWHHPTIAAAAKQTQIWRRPNSCKSYKSVFFFAASWNGLQTNYISMQINYAIVAKATLRGRNQSSNKQLFQIKQWPQMCRDCASQLKISISEHSSFDARRFRQRVPFFIPIKNFFR